MRNAHRRNTASHPLSTIRELAAWLQINPAALYRAAQTGKIPASKAGGRWWFSREAVEHWILDRMNAQTALIEELGPWLLDFSRRSATSRASVSLDGRAGPTTRERCARARFAVEGAECGGPLAVE